MTLSNTARARRELKPRDPRLPAYAGLEWIDGELPTACEKWPRRKRLAPVEDEEATRADVHRYTKHRLFIWPRRDHVFLCDMHADADAFLRSLVASGAVEKTGPRDADLRLTAPGRESTIVIGGDCFDKGPHNIRMLRAIGHLVEAGADVEILAGNHDVRTFMGLKLAGRKETLLAHLFVRMGKKTLPLFAEVYDHYLRPIEDTLTFLPEEEVRRRLFPSESWYEEFPAAVGDRICPKKLLKELTRIREKCEDVTERARLLGLSLGQVYAALEKARELFCEPGGELSWYFDRMVLAHRAGSFLFVHAGVDDAMADVLLDEGVEGANRRFRALMETDLFELYHGSVGNMFRTKYRDIDKPLSRRGVRQLHRAGIHAIVHGHKNVHEGQRLVLRDDLLHFECDASVDAGTRRAEGLQGPGGAATVISGEGRVLGISTDYPLAKVFEAREACGMTTFI